MTFDYSIRQWKKKKTPLVTEGKRCMCGVLVSLKFYKILFTGCDVKSG